MTIPTGGRTVPEGRTNVPTSVPDAPSTVVTPSMLKKQMHSQQPPLVLSSDMPPLQRMQAVVAANLRAVDPAAWDSLAAPPYPGLRYANPEVSQLVQVRGAYQRKELKSKDLGPDIKASCGKHSPGEEEVLVLSGATVRLSSTEEKGGHCVSLQSPQRNHSLIQT